VEAYAKNWDPAGALTKRGMVAAPEDVRKASVDKVASMPSLNGDELK
jgi:phosphate transport system substrate-binding protein